MAGRTVRTGLAVLGALALLAGCGRGGSSEPDSAPPEVERPARAATSSPIAVGSVPEGFALAIAGVGTSVQSWHSSAGDDEASTVLARAGSTDRRDLIEVRVVANGGDEGPVVPAGTFERFLAEQDGRPAFLTLGVTEDVALTASGFGVDQQLLAGVLEGAKPIEGDHAQAAEISDPPPGWEVLGSIDADAVLATYGSFHRGTGTIEAYSSGHVVGYEGDAGEEQLTVQVLPAGAVDLPALAVFQPPEPDAESSHEVTEVAGRPAALVRHYGRRSLFTTAPWGDVLVVSDRTTTIGDDLGGPVLGDDDLVDTAASVVEVDEAAWADLVEEADGGSELLPDPGRTEIARGVEGDVEWLLQTGDGSSSMVGGGGAVDPCLRLSTHRRACAPKNGTSTEWAGPGDSDDLPPFAIVATERDAAAVRFVTVDGEVLGEAAFHSAGDGPARAAVVFAEVTMIACADPADLGIEFPEDYVVARAELLDEAGAPIGCHGDL